MPSPVAVKDFEIEPMANKVFGVTGNLASLSRTPYPFRTTTSPSLIAATAIPGTFHSPMTSSTKASRPSSVGASARAPLLAKRTRSRATIQGRMRFMRSNSCGWEKERRSARGRFVALRRRS